MRVLLSDQGNYALRNVDGRMPIKQHRDLRNIHNLDDPERVGQDHMHGGSSIPDDDGYRHAVRAGSDWWA